jgi:hypothetical protein
MRINQIILKADGKCFRFRPNRGWGGHKVEIFKAIIIQFLPTSILQLFYFLLKNLIQ